MLVVFAALPGTGKTTLARLIGRERRATYLRIDTIGQALRSSGTFKDEIGPAGYVVAYALAEANLHQGQIVVVDCVNPLGITRAAWRDVAAAAATVIAEIEIVCSDPAEHGRRIETRAPTSPAWPRRIGPACRGTNTRRGMGLGWCWTPPAAASWTRRTIC